MYVMKDLKESFSGLLEKSKKGIGVKEITE